MTNDLVNICFVTDNNYVQHTLVALASMLAHKYPTSCYKVYIICDKVDDERKDMMMSFETDGFEVDIVDYDNTTYAKKEQEFGKYISSATYIRLKLPTIFPNVGKMLYLDGDIIVQDDLSEFFFMDLEGKAMAGVLDYGMCIDSLKWPKVEYIRQTMPNFQKEYVNAGVLLLDLNELRKIGFENTCERLYCERNEFIFADQDCLNFALVGRKKLVPIYWNFPILSLQVNYGGHDEGFLKEMIEKIYHVRYDNYLDLAYKSRIIHLNGNKKRTFDTAFLGTLYDRYLKMAMEYAKGDVK